MSIAAAMPGAPRRAPSLERRLMLRLGMLYLIALMAVTAIYAALAWSHRHIEIADDLDPAIAQIIAAIHPEADGAPRLEMSTTLLTWLREAGFRGVTVIDRTTRQPIAGSPSPRDFARFPLALLADGEDGDLFIRSSNGTTHYRAVRAVDTAAGKFWIEFRSRAKASAVARAWIWDEVGDETLPVMLALLAATLLISWFTLSASFRPVRRLAREARRITGEGTGLRLARRGVPREILPVVEAANLALERMEDSLEAQRQLMANIAHELRTPLAILRARIESLADAAVAGALLPDYERIVRLVDRLLTVARLQSAHLPFDQRYELVRVVRDCLAQMAPLAIAQGKELVLAAPEVPIYVRGNPIALEDAIRNLIDNAMRHSPAGRAIELTIRPGSSIEVRDHGPGVPASMRDQILRPFWRGAIPGGAGLGLAIVAETVKRHAGRLSVVNGAGGGAIFRLEIPQIA